MEMELTIKDSRLRTLILVGPFSLCGNYVFSKYLADVTQAVKGGSLEEKVKFLNNWWKFQ